MSITYRVRAHPFEREDMIYETFETLSDAMAFWEELQETTKVFEKVPYDAVVITLEDFHNGMWVPKSVKTVIR